MGLFDRFRSARRVPVNGNEVKLDTSDQDALRLIDEGNAFEDAGQLKEAMQCYEAAILHAPTLARAHLNRGNILLASGSVEGALEAFSAAIKYNPDYAAAHYNQGNVNARMGRHEAALEAYREAIRLKPEFVDAVVALGCVQEDLGRFEDAADSYRRALKIRPDYAEVHGNLGKVLHNLGQLEDAVASYRRALEIDASSVIALINLGDAHRELGKPGAAVVSYQGALEIAPNFVIALIKLGNALVELGQYDSATVNFRRALEIEPNSVIALNNLGNALKELGQLDAAIANYHRALEIEPDDAETYSNLGIAQVELGQLDEAVKNYRCALKIKFDYSEAHSNLGIALLEMGCFSEGWPEYEYRWEAGKPKPQRPPSSLPQWVGQATASGDSLLLFVEQGLGDMLHFARYLPLVAERFSGKVSIFVGRPLRALFRRSFPMIEVLDVLPVDQSAWQWQCPLLSLPLAFGTTLETIPRQIPYLTPDPIRVACWRSKIDMLGLPPATRKIGVVWKPGAAMKTAHLKAISLQEIATLLNQPSCAWFSLQKEPDPAKSPWVASGKLIDWSEEFGDFDETAALAVNMEIIISVDTSVAHLAGALGLTTWLFNRHASDWRWMRGREYSPWYPTIRIFTQKIAGEWGEAVERMRSALTDFPARGDRR